MWFLYGISGKNVVDLVGDGVCCFVTVLGLGDGDVFYDYGVEGVVEFG